MAYRWSRNIAPLNLYLVYGTPLTKNLMRRRIHVCSNSRAALAALAKTTTESSLVWECVQVLEKLSKFNKVTLMWIPGQ
jgi:hypothetical protein